MARGTRSAPLAAPRRAGGGTTARAQALWDLLAAAGVPAAELARTVEGEPCAAPSADVPGIALGAVMHWMDAAGGAVAQENAEEIWRLLLVESDRMSNHTFFWGDERGGYWSAGAGLAARRWYQLPETSAGSIPPAALGAAVVQALRTPRPSFLAALRQAPLATLAACAGPVRPLAEDVPESVQARCATDAHARIVVTQALALAADLDPASRETLLQAAAAAPPLGVAPAQDAPALCQELIPATSAEGLPVLTPRTPLGCLLADAVTAAWAHGEADRVHEAARQALGVDDDARFLERQRSLVARSPFHSRAGRDVFQRAVRREETRLRALIALARGVDVPRAPRERLLRAA